MSDKITPISALEAKKRLDEGWKPFIIDVRLPKEVEICKLASMDLNCPHTELQKVIAQIPKDRDLLVYCKMGGRGNMACCTLVEHGFTNIYDLKGGIIGWANDVDKSLEQY
eukprot:CAMPEP_0171459452 /NCGR_PEP_ID=MMETSP0945-20130129/4731_1 /TAXON_ID=109269 /ORGANISM="Vaucheria litorea, Strain CCMP2940" /LENGTH=110 /DNA_ID=CAMNT_0011985475 /DNA_START=98 /DNA_END=430 /DNA_ORIENTATION=-